MLKDLLLFFYVYVIKEVVEVIGQVDVILIGLGSFLISLMLLLLFDDFI